MAAGLVTLTFLDGTGASKTGQFWSSDGTTSGTLQPTGAWVNNAGTAYDPATEATLLSMATSTAPVNTYPFPATPVSGYTTLITDTTSTAVTGISNVSGKNNYITGFTVGNSDATVGTFVEFQDGSGGTTFFKVPAAALYGGVSFTPTTPIKQPTANTALYVKCTTTSAEVVVSVVGFQA